MISAFYLISNTLPAASNLDLLHDVHSNLVNTLHLLQSACQAGVRRIVFTSSGGTVYGKPCIVPVPIDHHTNPTCSYGIIKLAIEKYLSLYSLLHGIESVVLCIANPYGERQRLNASQGAIAVFLGRALRCEPIEIWGDGSVVRDYVYVGDVASALLAAASYAGSSKVFNVGSGQGHSLNQVIHSIEKELDRPLVVNYLPLRQFDVPINVLDISTSDRELGWRPSVNLSEGLRRFHYSLLNS